MIALDVKLEPLGMTGIIVPIDCSQAAEIQKFSMMSQNVKEMSKINIIHHTSQDRKVCIRLWAYAPKDKIVCPLLQFATSWKTFKFLLFEMTG